MLIQIGYNSYKFWNCSENKIEVASDTLKLLGLDYKFKYFFKTYDEVLHIISEKTKISISELYKLYKINKEGFN